MIEEDGVDSAVELVDTSGMHATLKAVVLGSQTLDGRLVLASLISMTLSEGVPNPGHCVVIEAESIQQGSGASRFHACGINRNGIDGLDITLGQIVHISQSTLRSTFRSTFRSNGNYGVFSGGSSSLIESSVVVGSAVGLRSYVLSSPSASMGYRGMVFSANSTNIIGGTQLGDNLCSGSLCP